jgi:Kef-type K+ transport system membrane component KefB
VAGLASSGHFDIATVFKSVLGAVLFLAIAFTIGRTIVDKILRFDASLQKMQQLTRSIGG